MHSRVHKDKIGDVSIKYQFGTDEAWTRALRHVSMPSRGPVIHEALGAECGLLQVLFDLKILLVMASKDVRPQA